MNITTRVEKDYEYPAAGHVWFVPEIQISVFDDGEEAIAMTEFDRIHRAVANEICGDPAPLTFEELEFLCDITQTPLAEVARAIGVHRSTVTKWGDTGVVSRGVFSAAIKRLFWFKLFGEEVRWENIPIDAVVSDTILLRYLHDRAAKSKLTEALTRVAA